MGWWANTDALNAALRGTSSNLPQEARRLGLQWSGRGGGVSVEVFKVFSLDKVLQRLVEQIIEDDRVVDWVQQRFVEQTFETPCVVLVEVWRGSGCAVCSSWTCSRCVHVEIWT